MADPIPNNPNPKKKHAKVIGLKQLYQKRYRFLEGLPEKIIHSFGKLVDNFIMIIWGQSGNGKSNFILDFVKALMPFGIILYVALEEGTESTTQLRALHHLSDDHNGKILFADHEMTYEELIHRLKRKKSPRFIIIDSIQYWNISYEQYKALKEMFPKKSFIFISHAKGKNPDGRTADKIRYDAGIKLFIKDFVGFPRSRYGGDNPYVIWEEGARKAYGKNYRKVVGAQPKQVSTSQPVAA